MTMTMSKVLTLGLCGFAIIVLLTVLLPGRWIENELSEQSMIDLEAAGFTWAMPLVNGRDVTLTGDAPDAVAGDRAMEIVEAVWGVRLVRDEINKP